MAEFGMQGSQQQMEWVSSYGGSYGAGGGGYGTGYQPSSSAYSQGYGGSSQPFGSISSGPNFDDEEPLLQELGIDLGGILQKTRAILLHRLNNKTVEDLDMGGALLFVFLLGGLHLLMGKLHFGVILGWSVVYSSVLWFLVNQLAGVDASEARGLDLYSCCCVVGYCQAPLAVLSAAVLLLPRGPGPVILGVLCTLWAALTAAKILIRRCSALSDMRGLLMVPCVLLFSSFAMLTLY